MMMSTMRPGIGASHRLETNLRIDPRVVLASQLLQLGEMELEQMIEAELAENPALERLDSESQPVRDEDVLKVVAPMELRPSSEDYEFRRSLPDDETADWTEFTPAVTNLRDSLTAQIVTVLPTGLQRIGLYLVECLNDKGYLEDSIEEIALALNCSMEEVEAALRGLQACEPAGIGARDLRECLMLQLADGATIERRLARSIVKQFLDEFVHRRTMRIARHYKVMPEVVDRAFEIISSLNPFPAETGEEIWTPRRDRSAAVQPDVILERSDAGWTVEVTGPEPGSLFVGRAYRRRLTELEKIERAPRDEKRHVNHFVQRAKTFISCVEQRRQTLRSIGEYLLKHQLGFVTTGQYQFLMPLTRSQMAADLGIHESTVSRATADKFVQLGNGEVVSFDVFFKPALRVQKMIEEILATENPDNPLSDERIAEILAERGVHVARRTVNKYRDRTKLLSSRKRRSA